MDTFRPPPQPSRMKLRSVPVTPDPGFPPQGRPLFFLPPARGVRPDAPSGQHSFSPPSAQAPPLPFQGSRPQERPSGGPPAPWPPLPGSAGHAPELTRGPMAELRTEPVPHLQELLFLQAEAEDFSGGFL